MSEILISVFTPTYNRASFLHVAFESLKKSTFLNFEWVIADDGSADDTAAVVAQMKKTAPFEIVYLPLPHRGKMRTMNEGVQHCRGRYFFELDSDDEILPDALEKLLAVWQQLNQPEQYYAVVGRCCLQDGTLLGELFPETVNEMSSKEFGRYRARHDMGACMSLARTDVIKQYPFPVPEELNFVPEATAWRRILLTYKEYYTNIPVYVYRVCADLNSFTAAKKPDPRPAYFYYTYFFNEIYPYDPSVTFWEYGVSAASCCHAAIRCRHKLSKLLRDVKPLPARVLCTLGWPLMWCYYQYQTKIQKREI